MSLEHSPSRSDGVATADTGGSTGATGNPEFFWFALIDEKEAAEYLDLTDRTLQKYRQTGGGPKFCRLSARSIKYRRHDLRIWSEAKLRASTSDPGPDAAAA